MVRRLASLLAASLLVACGQVTRYSYEPGSVDALTAEYIAEWGGYAPTYRSILTSTDCTRLQGERASYKLAEVPDTEEWREAKGYAEAATLRSEQVGCGSQ